MTYNQIMKFKLLIALSLVIASVSTFAQGNEGFQRLPNGVQYKIFTPNTGTRIKLNDVITFNFIQKTDKDSVLFSSFDAGRPVTLAVQPSRNISDLMYFFPLLSVKDSALVKVPSDSLFTDSSMQRPPFFPKGSSLQFVIRVEKVQSMDQAIAEQQRLMDSLKTAEATKLEKYITDRGLKMTKTASGLRYSITRPSVKVRPLAGDTVLVNYTGRTLDGKVFDSSIEADAKKAGLEQPGRTYEPISVVVGQGQVIKGWDEGLLLLNEGSKASFLIPSDLAYGPRGAGNDIAPFSSLLFDVELVKVKPAKKAGSSSATSAKKTPAAALKSKTGTKAPAKKTGTKAPVKKAVKK